VATVLGSGRCGAHWCFPLQRTILAVYTCERRYQATAASRPGRVPQNMVGMPDLMINCFAITCAEGERRDP
jgi:hypothetical protein